MIRVPYRVLGAVAAQGVTENLNDLERATGLEPATACLGSR